MKWLYENWYKSTPFLAFYMLFVLVVFVFETNFSLFLIWLQFVVYLLHQFEEYIAPGGFLNFFNKKLLGSEKSDFPLGVKASFWINIPVIFVAYPLSAILADHVELSIGIWTAYFSIINAASHVGMFFKYGYNPGLLVSMFLNIPVGLYTIYYFQSESLLSWIDQSVGLGIGLFIQVALMAYGFKILKPKGKQMGSIFIK